MEDAPIPLDAPALEPQCDAAPVPAPTQNTAAPPAAELDATIVSASARSRSGTSQTGSANTRSSTRTHVDPILGKEIGGATITGFVGEGGMGRVYLGELTNPPRRVAVKLLSRGFDNPESVGRFQREAAILDRLRHPGVAEILGHGVWDDGSGGIPFMLIELVEEAKTLADFANEKRLDRRARLELFHRACEAIGFAHEMKILHRDLKPANLLVDRWGRVKVIDFGVARAANGDLGIAGVRTETGQLIGTVQYMSPEQIAGDPRAIDLSTDVYALGVILYEMLLDAYPYDVRGLPLHEAARVVSEAVIEMPRQIDASIDPTLEVIVMRCLDRDRTRRFATAVEVAAALEHYLAGPGVASRSGSAVHAEGDVSARSTEGHAASDERVNLGAGDDLSIGLDTPMAGRVDAPRSASRVGLASDSKARSTRNTRRPSVAQRNSAAARGGGGGSARRGWSLVIGVVIVFAACGLVATGIVEIKQVRAWLPGSLGGTASPASAVAAEPFAESAALSTESLMILSAPEGASVSIDGKVQGQTPLSLMVTWNADSARRTIEVSAPNYEGAAAILVPDPAGRRAEPLRMVFNLEPGRGAQGTTLDRLLPLVIEGGAIEVRVDDGAPQRLTPGRREVAVTLRRTGDAWRAPRVTIVAPGQRIDAFGKQGRDTLTVEISPSEMGDQPHVVRILPK